MYLYDDDVLGMSVDGDVGSDFIILHPHPPHSPLFQGAEYREGVRRRLRRRVGGGGWYGGGGIAGPRDGESSHGSFGHGEGPSASGESGERLKEKTRVKLCAPAQGPPQASQGGVLNNFCFTKRKDPTILMVGTLKSRSIL